MLEEDPTVDNVGVFGGKGHNMYVGWETRVSTVEDIEWAHLCGCLDISVVHVDGEGKEFIPFTAKVLSK